MKLIQGFTVMEEDNMKIAVLSGKGGTGKTLLSVNLASSTDGSSSYVDCDVEEPNGHLFFKPENIISEDITVKMPVVDDELCNGCRKCVEFCNFNALAYVPGKLHIFEDICHSCGGCSIICPENALSEKDKKIGVIERGLSSEVEVDVNTGILNIGEASGIPIIDGLLDNIREEKDFTFIDCPPGSACIVMESIKDADYCLLVAEPTLFGVHNLNMVHELVKLFEKPHGVVINKCIEEDNPAEEYCLENGIKILGRIPYDSKLGIINSNAQIAAKEDQKYYKMFSSLLKTVVKEVQNETIINP